MLRGPSQQLAVCPFQPPRLKLTVCAQNHLRASGRGLKRLQEVDQVLRLLPGEAYLEALVIEIHDLLQIGGYSVMEVRRPCSQPS